MGSYSSLGTTFDIPNYTGDIFGISPTETPLLSMIGGLNGGKAIQGKSWEWQTYDLKTPGFGTAAIEGDAPTYNGRTRDNVSNVVQIFKYGVELSYSALGNTQQLASHFGGFTTDADQTVGLAGANQVSDEMAWQLMRKLEEAAVDVNHGFWNNTFANPTSNASGRVTRGLLEAISTNLITLDSGAAAPADLDGTTADTTLGAPLGSSYIENLLKDMYDGAAPMNNLYIFCNSAQKTKITQAYSQNSALAPRDRTVGGVAIDTIVTDFATVGVVLDRHLPQDRIVIANLGVVTPVFRTIPNKGHFFTEMKPSDGDSVKMMLYGEIGLEYGPETWHGQIDNLTT
jgi:hypothetical protein